MKVYHSKQLLDITVNYRTSSLKQIDAGGAMTWRDIHLHERLQM